MKLHVSRYVPQNQYEMKFFILAYHFTTLSVAKKGITPTTVVTETFLGIGVVMKEPVVTEGRIEVDLRTILCSLLIYLMLPDTFNFVC